jgi:hypothetical protein
MINHNDTLHTAHGLSPGRAQTGTHMIAPSRAHKPGPMGTAANEHGTLAPPAKGVPRTEPPRRPRSPASEH